MANGGVREGRLELRVGIDGGEGSVISEHCRGLLMLAGSALVGAVGWSGRFEWLPLAVLVLLFWRLCTSRLEAFLCPLAYYGAASAPWISASARFFGGVGVAVLLWVVGSLLLALPWALLWSPGFSSSGAVRLSRGLVLMAALMLPPWGLLSWANPWVGGVALFPGLGLVGFLVVTLCVFAPCGRSWLRWAAGFALISALCCEGYRPPEPGVAWAGVSTRFGRLEESSVEGQYDRALELMRAAERTGAELVLFPEGVAGHFSGSTSALYGAEAGELGKVLLVGAFAGEQGELRNGLVVVGDGEPRFWAQRLPVPVGMWAPWKVGHVKSALFDSGVRSVEGRRAAMLMCFEQFVSWPALQSALVGVGRVLAPANLWFARGTPLNAVREVTLRSWAALMGWSVVEAVNG